MKRERVADYAALFYFLFWIGGDVGDYNILTTTLSGYSKKKKESNAPLFFWI